MNRISEEKRRQYLPLIKEYGSPLYVYEGETFARQVSQLKEAFSGFQHKLHFAAKALSNQTVLKLIQRLGCGLDAVSIEEVKLGLLAGFQATDILFTPNNAPFEETEEAVELGVHINLESLSALEKFGKKYGSSYPVFIRLNPHILAGGNPKIQTGHVDSKFGISIFQLPEIKAIVRQYAISVSGLHVHTGSEIVDPDVFVQGARILFQAAASFPDIRYIDFGSGFKARYKSNDVVTPLEAVGEALTSAVSAFQKTRPLPVEIWFEPGKFIVSEAGILLCTVTTLKKTPSSTFLGVDTGLNHLIRPMMYDAYHEIENISRSGPNDHIYNVVGYICETDTLGYQRPMPQSEEGDILAIRNAGAYGFSMASNYNSRLLPAEVLIWKGKTHLIRKRQSFTDLLQHQVDTDLG